MKICFVNFSNPDVMVDHQNHFKNFRNLGVETYLFTNKDGVNNYDKKFVVTEKDVTKIRFLNEFILGLKLCSFCRRNDINKVVFLYRIGLIFTILPFIYYRIIKGENVELIYDLRSGSIYSSFVDFVFKVESLFFDKVIVVSDELKTRLFRGRERVFTIGLGVPVKSKRLEVVNKFSLPVDKCLYVYCGTFVGRELEVTIPKIDWGNNKHLVMIGGGDDAVLSGIKSHFESMGLLDHFHYLGVLPHDEAMDVISLCKVGINLIPLSKQYECQPSTKLLEYMSNNLVVCTTSHKLSIDFLKNNDYPYFIYNDSITTHELTKMRSNSKKISLNSWLDVSKKFLSVIRSDNVKI